MEYLTQDALLTQTNALIMVRTSIENNFVLLRVIDNGSGFSTDILPRVFEPYVTTKPKGTGLGLAIVKKIVEELQGVVEIRNIDEGGACVCVKLPLPALISA